jgi:hypothetical protein
VHVRRVLRRTFVLKAREQVPDVEGVVLVIESVLEAARGRARRGGRHTRGLEDRRRRRVDEAERTVVEIVEHAGVGLDPEVGFKLNGGTAGRRRVELRLVVSAAGHAGRAEDGREAESKDSRVGVHTQNLTKSALVKTERITAFRL